MSVIIEGYNKPKSCLSCPFNHSDCWCAITKGGIDRDDYSCDLPCPIKPLDSMLNEIQEEIVKSGDAIVGDSEYFTGVQLGMISALKIIDKHKRESEG